LVVSHGDPIKFAIAATLGLNIDDFQKIVVDPASLTIIDWKNRTLIAANVPLTEKKASSKTKKASLRRRRVLGGGTNV
jgi:broad specificity phosphatase PhoE